MTFVGTLKKNVFLVGFMGVGKTTVARRMARDMGVACVDVDAFLERKHGRSAAELFGELGEDALRELAGTSVGSFSSGSPEVPGSFGALGPSGSSAVPLSTASCFPPSSAGSFRKSDPS